MMRVVSLWSRVAAVLVGLALFAGCSGGEEAWEPHRGPIVLITLDALRADVVEALGGEPGLTPNLDRLASEATWAGRAVAPSSWTVPSMASIFTGLQPWKHQATHAGQAHLRVDLLTLPEALSELGFETLAYRSNRWLSESFGYAQGFDSMRQLNRGKRARAHLESLGGAPVFLWIHILPPHTPYVLRPRLLERLGQGPSGLPRSVRPLDLEPYFDPSVPLPEAVRERFWTLYRLNVAWADERLGELLDALRRSGQWERTLLAVTADHGEEFGEAGQSGHGGNLSRVLLEVPLVVKLPQAYDRPLVMGNEGPVATIRLWSTLVEAAGGHAVPAAAPSLFHSLRQDAVLSELYLGNGTNRFSLIQGEYQLHWESRFAVSEPEYFRARWSSLGGEPVPAVSEPVDEIFGRLEAAFARTLPLSGNGAPPELRLERWTAQGVESVDDPERIRRLARLLSQKWMHHIDEERPPSEIRLGSKPLTSEDAERLRSLGYVTP